MWIGWPRWGEDKTVHDDHITTALDVWRVKRGTGGWVLGGGREKRGETNLYMVTNGRRLVMWVLSSSAKLAKAL